MQLAYCTDYKSALAGFIILCQITSQFVKDNYAIALDGSDFKTGSLNKPSNIRPNRLFTAEKSIITRKIGTVKPEVFEKVTDKLIEIVKH
ncbi:type II toxin-antitoxin system PemK/MazF family toxin [Saccharicrinis sp. 156]|uniref:type II toxin-antitoxin system PemK/MazF family toxin n=1 Tax=Saccharicrinis sp. 156 TaxID=3417574 RepID=UPI003D340EBA